jgi:hypothetical protein
MFASLLRPKKTRVSETTPLLAALSKYRALHNGGSSEPADGPDDYDDHDDPDDHANGLPYDAELDDEDDDGRRDGPLLPVFSAELLGPSPPWSSLPPFLCCANQPPRPHPNLRQHAQHSRPARPAMRDDPQLGPAALPAGLAVPRQAHPAADPLRPVFPRRPLLPARQLSTI